MNVVKLRRSPEAVLEHIADGAQIIVGIGNGEPAGILDTIEANAERFHDVRLHQMLTLRKRRYIDGAFPGLRHVSWFLSPASRAAFHAARPSRLASDRFQMRCSASWATTASWEFTRSS